MSRGLPPQPKHLAENGKRPCRGCGGLVPYRRSTWCSNECKESHYMGLSGYARAKVKERDHCICALCGADCDFLRRIAWVLKRLDERDGFRLVAKAWGAREFHWGWDVGHTWEADHIVPLAEGGENTLSNYRTLCISCHKAQTKALAGRLAAAKRAAKQPMLALQVEEVAE